MNKVKPTDIFVLILMCTLFGLTFIATKFALQGLGIFQVVFGRYCLAFFILIIVFRKKLHHFSIASHDIKHFLTLTMVEPVGYFIMETYGVHYSSPSSVSLIIATIPVFAMISAFFILKEKLSIINVSGIFISILGVYFIVTLQKSTELAPQPIVGNFLTLGAAMAAGLYNSLARRLAQKYSPLTLTYYQTLVATIVFFPLAFIEYFFSGGFQINAFIIGNVFYLAIGGSIFAYFLLNRALSRLGSAQVAVFANFIPVITIIISYFAFDEMLRPIQFAGAGCVLAGIYLTYKQKIVK